ASIDAEALRYRSVRVRGEYLAGQQLLIDNKVHGGRAGFDVVAPLRIANSDRYVLVDRGWVAQGRRRTDIPEVSAPPGFVTVSGRANIPPRRYLELGARAPASKIWQTLDIGRIAAASALPLLPFVIEQTEPVQPPDSLLREWPAPDVGATQNWSYTLQWYSFAALAIVLWLLLNWRRVEDRRGGG